MWCKYSSGLHLSANRMAPAYCRIPIQRVGLAYCSGFYQGIQLSFQSPAARSHFVRHVFEVRKYLAPSSLIWHESLEQFWELFVSNVFDWQHWHWEGGNLHLLRGPSVHNLDCQNRLRSHCQNRRLGAEDIFKGGGGGFVRVLHEAKFQDVIYGHETRAVHVSQCN